MMVRGLDASAICFTMGHRLVGFIPSPALLCPLSRFFQGLLA
jgi:hypothetical protein